jgi:hypothetical protein
MATPFFVEAQSFYAIRRDRSLILSAGTGTSTYFGELKDADISLKPDPSANLNVGLQYFFSNRIALRTELNWFQLRGSDEKTVNITRNLSFTSNNYELNAAGLVNLFPNGHRFYQRSSINFYGFLGVGVLYMNPKAELNGKKYALQPLRTEDKSYSRIQFVVPYGIGAKVKAGPFFNVALEGGWRLTFTDYMDDVSTVHPDKTTWTDPIRIALSDRRLEGNPDLPPSTIEQTKRGNPEKKDSYFLLNIKVEYYLANNFIFGNANSRKLYKQKRKSYYHRNRRR